MTSQQIQEVADTMIQQLGGRQIFALAFTGRDCERVNGTVNLTLTVAPSLRRASKTKWIRIALQADDTYSVEFLKSNMLPHTEFSGVYCDQLKSLVEKTTGLYLSLFA